MTYPYSSGDVVTASDMNSGGLHVITPSSVTGGTLSGAIVTIGSAVSSVVVNGVFSSTFENYLITLAGGSSTVSGALGLQLGSETSAYYGSFIYALTGGGSPAQVNDNNAARFTHIASAGGSFLSAQINIHMPFTATQTTVSSQGVTYGTVNGTYNGVLATSTSYSSFVFVCGSGTMTGGTIRVYGYNNG